MFLWLMCMICMLCNFPPIIVSVPVVCPFGFLGPNLKQYNYLPSTNAYNYLFPFFSLLNYKSTMLLPNKVGVVGDLPASPRRPL